MGKVSIIGDNIISPLGFSTGENLDRMYGGSSGLTKHLNETLQIEFTGGLIDKSVIDDRFSVISEKADYTFLEKTSILSILDAAKESGINLDSEEVLFILSTTKGNIELLNEEIDPIIPRERVYLATMAATISSFFGNKNKPIVISNACISGVMGIITAKRFLTLGKYKHIVVVGCDAVTDFTLSGFYCLKALSIEHCMPFDRDRIGINLGDACGTVILSSVVPGLDIDIKGGAVTNDANHISGPARDGQGMVNAIAKTMVDVNQPIDYISAHGTATRYNDDMEATALFRSGLDQIPVNSLKGYWGHTLGAAGILESIAAYRAIIDQRLMKNYGCKNVGTVQEINVIKEAQKKDVGASLKTASGFGGCNASVAFVKRGS